MKRSNVPAWWGGAALLGLARAADAHIVGARLGDFYAGALHPLTDLQDVVLWTALGLFAGSIGPASGRWLLLAVPAGLLAGVVLGFFFPVELFGTLTNAVAMLALGLSIAAGVRLRTVPLCAIAFCLAVMRGAVTAADVAPETNRVLFSAGLASVGYAGINLIMAATVAFRSADLHPTPSWRAIAIRVCGSWIAAIGLMIGGLALAS